MSSIEPNSSGEDPGQSDSNARIQKRLEERRKQGRAYRENPAAFFSELRSSLGAMESANAPGADKEFFAAWHAFKKLLQDFEGPRKAPEKTPLSAEFGNEVAERLIKIFSKRRAEHPVAGGDFDAEMAARFGSNDAVKHELLKALKGGSKNRRERVLFGLSRGNPWIANREIYDALEALLSNAEVDDMFVLAVMQKIDRERTLPHYERVIETTNDPSRFYQASSSVNVYRNKDLLERIFRRVPAIPRTGRRSMFGFGLLNIDAKLILGYIEGAEGEDLRIALQGFAESNPSIREGYPLLVSKLKSGNSASRLAIIKCMNQIAKRGTWQNPETLRDLKEHLKSETDETVRRETSDGISWLSTRTD